jgi:hypothetical protein
MKHVFFKGKGAKHGQYEGSLDAIRDTDPRIAIALEANGCFNFHGELQGTYFLVEGEDKKNAFIKDIDWLTAIDDHVNSFSKGSFYSEYAERSPGKARLHDIETFKMYAVEAYRQAAKGCVTSKALAKAQALSANFTLLCSVLKLSPLERKHHA